MEPNHWYKVKHQSLAVYARDAGFDLAIYNQYSDSVKEELRRRSVTEAIYAIASECEEQGCKISAIRRGVYVISLSYPLSIRYERGRSQVIYIGRGNIIGRIKAHFNEQLFEFMHSLSGADFDFSFANPARQNSPSYYKHVEHLMLEYFAERFGGSGKRRFPILNRYAGTDRHLPSGNEWWKMPLTAPRKGPLWELRPTDFSDFRPLDNTE